MDDHELSPCGNEDDCVRRMKRLVEHYDHGHDHDGDHDGYADGYVQEGGDNADVHAVHLPGDILRLPL